MAKKESLDSSSPSPPDAEAPPGPPSVSKSPYGTLRENLEALIVAVILALIIRHFSVEAFEIPTGSMAPTLFGIHAWVSCPNCDTEFNVGLRTDLETGKLNMPYQRRMVYLGSCLKCKVRHHRAYDAADPGQPLAPGKSLLICGRPECGCRWQGEAGDFQEQAVIAQGDDLAFECPLCQFRFKEVIEKSNLTGGHKILVNKFAYRVGKPRRWDVIVFQMNEVRNYIKRLLGLPGETVWIQGGDLYVQGPGESQRHIERKAERPEVQENLWTRLADSSVAERGYNPEPAWREAFEQGSGGNPSPRWQWSPPLLRWTVEALRPEGHPKEDLRDPVAILKFNRRSVDFYNYNLLAPSGAAGYGRAEVGDKKLAFTVRPLEGEGWIGGEIRDGSFAYQFRVPVGQADSRRPAALRRLPAEGGEGLFAARFRHSPDREPPEPLAAERAEAAAALPLSIPSRLEFENVDDRVAVRLDGKEILALEYSSGSPVLRSENEHYLLLLAGGVRAELEALQVFRDVYYAPGVGSPDPARKIESVGADGENGYFACGDNSPNSFDSRMWGTVPERNLMGKALLVFWPAWPANWQCKFIR